jgi:hypothetical protein
MLRSGLTEEVKMRGLCVQVVWFVGRGGLYIVVSYSASALGEGGDGTC